MTDGKDLAGDDYAGGYLQAMEDVVSGGMLIVARLRAENTIDSLFEAQTIEGFLERVPDFVKAGRRRLRGDT